MVAIVPFSVGKCVRVFDHKESYVDDAEVLRVEEYEKPVESTYTALAEVELRSIQLEPGTIKKLVFFIELGWRMLMDDPLQDGVQYINPSPEAEYRLEEIEG